MIRVDRNRVNRCVCVTVTTQGLRYAGGCEYNATRCTRVDTVKALHDCVRRVRAGPDEGGGLSIDGWSGECRMTRSQPLQRPKPPPPLRDECLDFVLRARVPLISSSNVRSMKCTKSVQGSHQVVIKGA